MKQTKTTSVQAIGMFETLETRQLMSAAVLGVMPRITPVTPPSVVLGVDDPELGAKDVTRVYQRRLQVHGTDGKDNMEVRSGALAGNVDVYRSGAFVKSVALSTFDVITMQGFGGNDTLKVAASINKSVYANGGAGNDTIITGAGNDVISAGDGNDNVSANDGNDNISLGLGDDMCNAGAGNDVVATNGGNDSVQGALGDDSITGDSGNDWLDGGWGNDTVKAQGGNDSVYGSLGDDKLYGGDGDDVLVSVFGGKNDVVNGDAGWDTFVTDDASTEKIYDGDTLATDRKSVYRIGNKFAGGSTSSELFGENIIDPSYAAYANGWKNFSDVPVYTKFGPRMTDVQQGQVGDCWFASSAASVAAANAWQIKRLVVPLGDGTYMVHIGSQNLRVDADLPVKDGKSVAYGQVNRPGGDSLWFPLLEKGMSVSKGMKYSGIESDTPGTAFNAFNVSYEHHTLAHVPFTSLGTTESEMFDQIKGHLGKAMTICTEPGFLGVGNELVSSHCYSVINAYTRADGTKMITLRNPWAYNDGIDGGDGEINVTASCAYSSCLMLYTT